MANGGGLRWEADSFYSPDQVAAVLKSLGISVESETDVVFLAYCPFHGNKDTPSFAVSKDEGLFLCYNPACARSGNLMQLIKWVGNLDDFGAKRLIAKSKRSAGNILAELSKYTDPVENFPEFKHKDRANYASDIRRDFWLYAEPQIYMRDRGFEKGTLKKFDIGYDMKVEVKPKEYMDMVCVPMHDPMGDHVVGYIRRSLKDKVFRNTKGLPTSDSLFNIHRAKRTGDTCIIVEASFSAMRLDQCGYPNAVSCLMGHFSQEHASLINKYFTNVVIMTDYDDKKKHVYPGCRKCKSAGSNLCMGHNPGEELGMKIASMLPRQNLMWAHYGGSTRFPEGVKDPDDMDDETIRHSIKNAISHFEYALD